jgi:thiol-disulfide isomerase/thioredoxin
MRTKLFITGILVIVAMAGFSQTQYEVSPDPNHPEKKILKGIISKDLIKNDSTYKWYEANQKGYTNPDTAIVGALHRDNTVKYVVFGGTWCGDTQFILPRFFMLQEKAGIADDRITFFGVDRQKKSLGNITSALNITNVPTIIVMKNGKEVGRVVEYGKTGKWDKELAEIVEHSSL